MYFKIWDRRSSVHSPDGVLWDRDTLVSMYPRLDLPNETPVIGHPFEGSSRMLYVGCLEELRADYKIPDSITNDQALQLIGEAYNNPPQPEPTAEERIAAAMEFQNLLAL